MSARMLVFTTPVTGREDEYAAWQREVHAPELVEKVAGIVSATCFQRAEVTTDAAPYLIMYELNEPSTKVLADIDLVLPSLEVSDSLDVADHPPRLMVYETY